MVPLSQDYHDSCHLSFLSSYQASLRWWQLREDATQGQSDLSSHLPQLCLITQQPQLSDSSHWNNIVYLTEGPPHPTFLRKVTKQVNASSLFLEWSETSQPSKSSTVWSQSHFSLTFPSPEFLSPSPLPPFLVPWWQNGFAFQKIRCIFKIFLCIF